MPKTPPPLAITHWVTGLVSNRNPLLTPVSSSGLSQVARYDALIDGFNVECSPQLTLQRRPGFPLVNISPAIPPGETILKFFSARLSDIPYVFIDTDQNTYQVTGGILSLLHAKAPGAGQTTFQQVGNTLYFSDGISNKKWADAGSGYAVYNMGVISPTTAPTTKATNVANTIGWFPSQVYPTDYYITDPYGNAQAQTGTGTPTSSMNQPLWNAIKGVLTTDSTGANASTWRNKGPVGGWIGTTAVVDSVIIDSNNNYQLVTTAGTTAATEPVWNVTPGGTTSDGTATWTNKGLAGSATAYVGYQYVYLYHTVTGQSSTASPASSTGPISGTLSVTVTGDGSSDPAVDRIDVYRTDDGGSIFYACVSVANTGAPWSVVDTIADADLDTSRIAPVADLNDPPPQGMSLLAYFQGRMWSAVHNLLFFAAGPDCTNGIPSESWPPANVFIFPGEITGLASTSSGLFVWTADNLYAIYGGFITTSYYPQLIISNFGLASPNCLAQDGDQVFFYSSSRQMWSLSSTDKEQIGLTVADTLANNFDPATSYVAIHRSGQDVGVFITDGSQNFIRYDIDRQSWGAIATPGVSAIGAVTVSSGNQQLYGAIGQNIVARNLNVFNDAGATYTGYGTIGSLLVAGGGNEPAELGAIYLQRTSAGSELAISVLQNETTGIFVDLPLVTNYPYGLPGSTSVPSKRYDWLLNQSMLPQITSHLQIRVDMAAEDAKSELLNLSLVSKESIT